MNPVTYSQYTLSAKESVFYKCNNHFEMNPVTYSQYTLSAKESATEKKFFTEVILLVRGGYKIHKNNKNETETDFYSDKERGRGKHWLTKSLSLNSLRLSNVQQFFLHCFTWCIPIACWRTLLCISDIRLSNSLF